LKPSHIPASLDNLKIVYLFYTLNKIIMKMLEGKNALITGGSRGIGKAIAIMLARHGANIAFTDLLYDDQARSVETEISALGVKVKGYASNAADYQETEKTADAVAAEFGTIDILVNNAGITKDGLLMRMTEDQWDAVINVNLKSVFNFTKAVQKYMLKQRSGSIINMSSVVGVSGNAGQSNYSASKAGILGFTKSVAKELGSRNIRCNAIAPGFIMTEMTAALPEDVKKQWAQTIPLKRGGTPEDVASVTLFLASDLSAYVSGQVISVCGGMQT
jgi:3-oxoacyl-[acyl-carrier protein] reductase